ncbi:MAG: hypothetical protein E4H22_01215, partial [Solirubrobacterales bacterium]
MLEHRLRLAPGVRLHAGPGERRPDVLLGIVEALDGGAPHFALEHLHAALWVDRDRDDAFLDPDTTATATADRADDDRAAAVDVAVKQAVQGDDVLV